jgi:PIN domain nuclease of toxin-antitoxin system
VVRSKRLFTAVRLPVDPHVQIWVALEDVAPPACFRPAPSNLAAKVHVSAVPVWEVAISLALGKLLVPADLFDQVAASGCLALPITLDHAGAIEALPLHHGDPFDHVLIALARVEGLTPLRSDHVFSTYAVFLL